MTENYFKPSELSTREPIAEDVPVLRTILEKSVVDNESKLPIIDEIEGVIERISASIDTENPDFQYLIAESGDGKILGVMGITRPDEEMSAYAEQPDTTVELVNAFVDPEVRKSGAGSKLVIDLLAQAKTNGATEVVVNSGPRYRETGWPFWARVMSNVNDVEHDGYGETALLKDKYGEGLDAMVWRKAL